MPTYTFKNLDTDEVFDKFMKVAEREEYMQNNKNLQAVLYTSAFVGGTGDRVKPDDGFKEVMTKIASDHPTSALANQYGRKTAKEVKNSEIAKKHLKPNLK